MNTDLKKYLSDVLSKDVKKYTSSSILTAEKKILVGIPDDRNNLNVI